MRKILRKNEIKELNEKIRGYHLELSKKDKVEINSDIIFVNGQPYFFYFNNIILPHLKKMLQSPDMLPKITVDMGAVKFVIGGADIMRPGIVFIDENIKKDDFCVIVDQNNKKPLAIGQALFSYDKMNSMKSGKVVKNVHYVGDKIWSETR